jgi:hypothetical protein
MSQFPKKNLTVGGDNVADHFLPELDGMTMNCDLKR